MPQSVIAYDKDLPEIPGRCPWLKPNSFLEKAGEGGTGWRVNTSGRRPSQLFLVSKLRRAVDKWRDDRYPGASDVTLRLFSYWFEEDHEVKGIASPFRYHFCQREAMETLAYIVEVDKNRDGKQLIDAYAEMFKVDLYTKNIEHQKTMDGTRQIRRYVPERDAIGVQDLPPERLRRYAFKMATGSGKTWVMAMVVVWSHFHKKLVKGSDLSTNFLIVAPNVIVYQRLEKDLASNRIFNEIPLIPPEWKGMWAQKVILRGESAEPDPSGNIFLTNIHQLHLSREKDWNPANAVEAMLGPPAKASSASERSMLQRIKELKDLIVLNDEAHHVHDEDLAWSQSLLSIHNGLPKGLALWLDFSATPKDQGGMYYPWIICDYPLAQAVEDRIVKAPIVVTKEDDPKLPRKDPDNITKDNVTSKFAYWINAAVERWKVHNKAYKQLGRRPILFMMVEKNAYADVLGRFLWKTKEFGFKESDVLVIHTDAKGEITKTDLEEKREQARDIDQPENKIKVIVSVMMLREGWDVRGVSVVLGLRPFTSAAEILPEQVIGRGLRLMTGIGPDRTQTLEVLGTRKLLDVLRTQLETDGVSVASVKKGAAQPVIIQAIEDRKKYDIAIPITKPHLVHNVLKLSDLKPERLEPIFEREELAEAFRLNLKMEFVITETEVHQTDVVAGLLPMAQELLSSLTSKVIDRAKLTNAFSSLYPLVRLYVIKRCFGKEINIEDDAIRSHLNRIEIQEGIAGYLAKEIGKLTLERKAIEFENATFKLSKTLPFSWRRDLTDGPCECKRTVFNYVATYNNYERRFAEFLDKAKDILSFASLGTTEQGDSATKFRVDYLKPRGAIGFYHPDWVAVQKTDDGVINWIIETKGRVWEDTLAKDDAITEWCRKVTEATKTEWRFVRVNQRDFDSHKGKSFKGLLEEIAERSRTII